MINGSLFQSIHPIVMIVKQTQIPVGYVLVFDEYFLYLLKDAGEFIKFHSKSNVDKVTRFFKSKVLWNATVIPSLPKLDTVMQYDNKTPKNFKAEKNVSGAKSTKATEIRRDDKEMSAIGEALFQEILSEVGQNEKCMECDNFVLDAKNLDEMKRHCDETYLGETFSSNCEKFIPLGTKMDDLKRKHLANKLGD